MILHVLKLSTVISNAYQKQLGQFRWSNVKATKTFLYNFHSLLKNNNKIWGITF